MKKRKNNLSEDEMKRLYELYKLPICILFGSDFAEEVYNFCIDSVKRLSGDKNSAIGGYMMAIADLANPEFKNFDKLVEKRNKWKEKMTKEGESE